MKIWTNFISISLNMQRSGLNVIVASSMLTQIQICTWKGIHRIYMNRVLDLKWLYSFHNKLKTPYLHGKVNRRVDFLLNVLLRIEEDNFFNYMKKVHLPTTQRDECNRHQNGMLIPAEKVQVSLSLWFFALIV